jgi:hypothetical protein
MKHLDEEALAGAALDDGDELGPRDRRHLVRCRACAGRLAELQQVVATGRSAQPYPLRPPRPGLLAAIQAELDRDQEPGTTEVREPLPVPVFVPDAESANVSPLRGSPGGRTRSRRHPGRWLLAAAVVVAVGVTGAVAYRQAGDDVLATAVLTPLPSKSGQGTAELIRSRDGQELSVTVTAPPPGDAFEELWLFDADGRGMISVGILPETGRATFPVPRVAGALNAYTVVDISLEPFDGDPAHSHNSILRGTLR